MDDLNFINQSSDKNNSSIVIFQSNSATEEIPVAWRIIPVDAGSSASVPASNNGEYYVAVANPEIAVNGGLMTMKEFSGPAVPMKAGQTAYIIGDASSGYVITVKN